LGVQGELSFVLLLIIQCFIVFRLFQLVTHNQLQPQ